MTKEDAQITKKDANIIDALDQSCLHRLLAIISTSFFPMQKFSREPVSHFSSQPSNPSISPSWEYSMNKC